MKNKIIATPDELKKIKDDLSLIFTGKEYPEPVFNKNSWNLIVLETWSIFDETTLATFKNFIKAVGDEMFMLCPDDLYSTNKFSIQINKSDLRQTFLLSSNITFKEFDKIQYNQQYHNLDSYIYGISKRWGLYTETNIGIMILGYEPEIEKIVKDYYEENEERITTIDYLLEEMSWAYEKNRESLRKLIKRNYSKAFKW